MSTRPSVLEQDTEPQIPPNGHTRAAIVFVCVCVCEWINERLTEKRFVQESIKRYKSSPFNKNK